MSEAGYWTAPRLWPGATVAILGGGESLTQADVDHCRCRVIAINDSWRLAPWADVLYGADIAWWRHPAPGKGLEARERFAGLMVRLSGEPEELPDVRLMRWRKDAPLVETDPALLSRSAGNSGGQALNLALHFGAARVLLLGFDMAGDHWHGRHPAGLNNPTDDLFARWRAYFTEAAPVYAAAGLRITNCSRQTALGCFPRASIEDCL